MISRSVLVTVVSCSVTRVLKLMMLCLSCTRRKHSCASSWQPCARILGQLFSWPQLPLTRVVHSVCPIRPKDDCTATFPAGSTHWRFSFSILDRISQFQSFRGPPLSSSWELTTQFDQRSWERHHQAVFTALFGNFRDAPQRWNQELRRTMGRLGFEHSRLLPGNFHHERRRIYLVPHVDDLLVLGRPQELRWLRVCWPEY